MALSRTGRAQSLIGRGQRLFLEALLSGHSIIDASVRSRVTRSTLYFWRHTDAAFRAAWDDAARAGADAATELLDGERMRRAVDGVDEPVFYKQPRRARGEDVHCTSRQKPCHGHRRKAAAR